VTYTPTAVKPGAHGCSCRIGAAQLSACSRYAVVRVGHVYYCAQHARLRGITVPL
jgi:hypothetical protein